MHRFLIFILLISFNQSIFALRPDRVYPYRPDIFGMIYKEFKIKTKDNIKINTWFFPAQDTLPLSTTIKNPIKREYSVIDNKRRPTIIICPADAGNMAPLAQFAHYICVHGYNVVTFDWRGFGESDNWTIDETNLCYTAFFNDINAVVDSIKHLSEVDTMNIGMFGFSMSAFVSFPVFNQRKDVKCFIGRALSTDYEGIRDYWAKKNKIVNIPSDYTNDFYPKNIAGQISKPCFLIVGELDSLTPPLMAQNIYSKLKGEKEIWIVKDVGHGVEWDKKIGLKNFTNKMIEFYDKHLK
jgi:pimeloyl-ACP methyl ester carboxylesterase